MGIRRTSSYSHSFVPIQAFALGEKAGEIIAHYESRREAPARRLYCAEAARIANGSAVKSETAARAASHPLGGAWGVTRRGPTPAHLPSLKTPQLTESFSWFRFCSRPALCALPLEVQPQAFIRDASWPSHAVLTLPRGWMKPGETLVLAENGRPVISQAEVAARWPDESPKYIHLYASFRYVDGKPANYEIEKVAAPPPDLPVSPLKVTDHPGGIRIETGRLSLFIPRPFAGLTKVTRQGKTILEGPGGPSLVDERGIAWRAVDDDAAEVVVEQQGPAQVTVKATGWYQTAERRVEPFCRFTTRITAFANSPLVKFDHATTFAADMRKHAISELAFTFATPGVNQFAASSLSGKFNGEAAAAWFAQLASDRLVTIDDSDPSASPQTKLHEAKAASGGWFAAESEHARIVLLAKDFWQKYPKEVKLASGEMVYYAWPRHGELSRLDPAATRLDRVYKFECFLTGRLLDSRLPSDFFSALEAQPDSTECKAVFARAANLEGVSMHNEFALVFLPPGGSEATVAPFLASLQQLYAAQPIATLGPAAIAASGVFGPVVPSGGPFAEVDRAVREGMLGYAHSIERWGDYGWCLYGNAHSDELMNPSAAGVPEGAPRCTARGSTIITNTPAPPGKFGPWTATRGCSTGLASVPTTTPASARCATTRCAATPTAAASTKTGPT